jgi:hypothetical protein
VCLIAIVGLYLLVGTLNPTTPIASAGSEYPRTGMPALFLAIPVLLGALRARKYDDPHSPALYAIPGLLAAGLLLTGIIAGYLPDDPPGCASLGVNPREFPDCFTTTEVRARTLIELVLVWLCFGVISFALGRLKRRRRARATNSP